MQLKYNLILTILSFYCFGHTFINISENAKVIFYLHGRIIEDQGVGAIHDDFGRYHYLEILDSLRRHGFQVYSEVRPKGTDAVKYASDLAQRIQEIISSGINPEDITVIGASKGAIIAMLTSTELQNNNVNFVFIANCNSWVYDNLNINLCGRILSIYENSDEIGRSCRSIFKNSTCEILTKEIELNTGLGHGFIFQPLKEWLEPAIQWALINNID